MMDSREHQFIAIDLKSFYASVECADRNLDAMTTNLVVADSSRTSKTICLAVSPSLKAHGISGRARLFEVEAQVKKVNQERLEKAVRLQKAMKKKINFFGFSGSSFDALALEKDPFLELSYIVAPPQMRKYMEISTQIYKIYLKYIAPEDIHVYSIDEVFIDATGYLLKYHMTADELAMTMIRDVLYTTGITATAGIGTNLYLCKIAMDIVAKHMPADENGVRIAKLDEKLYRKLLWTHEPITDFWRVGRGTAARLAANGMYTMGDIARCSIGKCSDFYNEDLLYRLFGINAELLIDHAWGWEPCTIDEIKKYKPDSNSLSSGQVLSSPYTAQKARLITHEMIDLLSLDLVSKRLLTNQLVITIGYDIENLSDPVLKTKYHGPVVRDHYGRYVPKSSHGSINTEKYTSSTKTLTESALTLYDRIINPNLLVRRINISANHLISESEFKEEVKYEQLNLFTDYNALLKQQEKERQADKRERQIQEALLQIKNRFGKNAILKGMNLQKGATTIQRNSQVGGHKE